MKIDSNDYFFSHDCGDLKSKNISFGAEFRIQCMPYY